MKFTLLSKILLLTGAIVVVLSVFLTIFAYPIGVHRPYDIFLGVGLGLIVIGLLLAIFTKKRKKK